MNRAALIRFGRRGLRTVWIGPVVASFIAIIFRQDFAITLVYSCCITVGCWTSIDGLRMLAAAWQRRAQPPRDDDAATPPDADWPGWRWMASCIVVGTLVGWPLGTLAGNALSHAWFGIPLLPLAQDNPRGVLAELTLSLVPGVFFTYLFYARARIASTVAAAEAAERLSAQTRLKLLESQLEPHMLFNTLANLRVLIALDPPRAQAMLDRLIACLRATLEASRTGSHPLSTEFERIADYLALMSVRMGPRLRTELDLPAELAGVSVPPLLLQPLVETAIKHGLEPRREGGVVRVDARRDGDSLVLCVRDSGVGLAGGAADGGTRFGLSQVRERLTTLYRGDASFTLQDADAALPGDDRSHGAVATVRIPWPDAALDPDHASLTPPT